MKSISGTLFAVALVVGSATDAVADGRPSTFDFEYVLQGPLQIPDRSLQEWALELMTAPSDPSLDIAYLELEITGLSHGSPTDLSIFLLDPLAIGPLDSTFGSGILVINDDLGRDGEGYLDVDLIFSDKATGAMPNSAIESGVYLPDGPGSFGQYLGRPFEDFENAPFPWRVLIIDDAQLDTGVIESITLRGTVVPEPMTLSLLAIGALALFRRTRRQG